MRQIPMVVLVSVVAVAVFTAGRSTADEPKHSEAKTENKLIGTWKVISAKFGGKDISLDGVTRLKHITPTQFIWVMYGPDGKVEESLGGPYTLKGKTYEETPEYGVGDVLEMLKGKPQTFECRVEGNKWYHTGKLSTGLTIEEVYERVENK